MRWSFFYRSFLFFLLWILLLLIVNICEILTTLSLGRLATPLASRTFPGNEFKFLINSVINNTQMAAQQNSELSELKNYIGDRFNQLDQ